MTTGINWTPTGAQAQSLIVYLQSLGMSATRALNIRTMLKRITDAYTTINTHQLLYGNIDSYMTAGNQGYVPDFTLLEAYSGLTRYIMDICAGTWNDADPTDPGACTTTGTIDTWIAANRPEVGSALTTLLHNIVATDINTNLLPGDVTDPADDTNIGNDANSNFNVYKRSVGTLLAEIARYLRHYCGPTTESDQMNMGITGKTISSSYGSYIQGLDIVNPVPRNIGLTGAAGA